MTNLRYSINKLRNKTEFLFYKTEFLRLDKIKDVEREIKRRTDGKIGIIPPNIDLENLLDKILNGNTTLTRREKKNIPFILYNRRCDIKDGFRQAITLLDITKENTIQRLLYVYFAQYDNSDKTKILRKCFKDIILSEKQFKLRHSVLIYMKNNKDIIFGEECMNYMSKKYIDIGNIKLVLKSMYLPLSLMNSNFMLISLIKFFQDRSIDIKFKYKITQEIYESKDLYDGIHHIIADSLIRDTENITNVMKKTLYKKVCLEIFYKLLGDPRFGVKRLKWDRVSKESRNIFLHWLAENDMKTFFEIIKETAVDRMWKYRLKFWKAYLPYISNTWVFFGKKAQFIAQNLSNAHLSYGHLGKGTLSNHSAFAFQIGKFIFLEWSHNGKLRVWEEQDAPKLFGVSNLEKITVLDVVPKQDWIHSSADTYFWQENISKWIETYCGISKYVGDWRV